MKKKCTARCGDPVSINYLLLYTNDEFIFYRRTHKTVSFLYFKRPRGFKCHAGTIHYTYLLIQYGYPLFIRQLYTCICAASITFYLCTSVAYDK